MDVTAGAAVEASVSRCLALTGGALDVLVNNAGLFSIQPFHELTPSTWIRTLSTNLTGPFQVTRSALRGLQRSPRPHVFNVASIAARQAFPGNVAYCASKYGLRGFSDALRLDLAPSGVRVSTLYPSATDTGIFDGVPGDWDRSRMHRPEDVAELVWRAYTSEPGTDVDDLVLGPTRPG
jgi:NAD(P)-dependent dehydrogenase (short-subunit alcohol dehydrogenase family)